MQRHILDKGRTDRQPHLDRIVRRETEDQPHKGTLTLQRRPATRSDTARLREFLRITRGKTA